MEALKNANEELIVERVTRKSLTSSQHRENGEQLFSVGILVDERQDCVIHEVTGNLPQPRFQSRPKSRGHGEEQCR